MSYTTQNVPGGKDERSNKCPIQGFKKQRHFKWACMGERKAGFHEKSKQIQVCLLSHKFIIYSKFIGRKLEIISIAVLLGKAFPVNKHYLTWALGERFCPAWLSHSDRRNTAILKILKNSFCHWSHYRYSPQVQILTAPSKLWLERGWRVGTYLSQGFPIPFPHKACSRVSTH